MSFRLGSTYSLLLAGNAAAWLWALSLGRTYPALLGGAVLAYAFGLRHAVDADHIAAIDNVTRKLIQEGRRPVTVGLSFSLGHASVVTLACAAIAAASQAFQSQVLGFGGLGRILGTGVSAAFLFAIGAANLASLAPARLGLRGTPVGAGDSEGRAIIAELSPPGGLLSRLLGPLIRLVSHPWQIYLLGFLFGLGFDTATEIGVIGLSAAHAAHAAPLSSFMVFPALFAAGMSLVDTTDGALMAGAYGWAFVRPARKRLYNLVVTLISAAFALSIGLLELLGLLADRLGGASGLWRRLAEANARSALIGCLLAAALLACWGVAALRAPARRRPSPARRPAGRSGLAQEGRVAEESSVTCSFGT